MTTKRPRPTGASQASARAAERSPQEQLSLDFERIHALVAGRLFHYIASEMQNGDISFTQQNALYTLFLAGRSSVGRLATELGLSQTATSHMIDRLVIKGLATREEDRDDRRRKVVALTEAGRERILGLKRHTIESYLSILAPLPADVIDTLALGLRRLADHLPPPTLPEVELHPLRTG